MQGILGKTDSLITKIDASTIKMMHQCLQEYNLEFLTDFNKLPNRFVAKSVILEVKVLFIKIAHAVLDLKLSF